MSDDRKPREIDLAENPQLKRIAEEYLFRGNTTGHVHMTECRTCGGLEWSSTEDSKPDLRLFVTEGGDFWGFCRACAAVKHRTPEVFEWVQNVVAHALARERRRKEGT